MGKPFDENRTAFLLEAFVIILAASVAAVSAQHSSGGWNDRSRLATVECLVDHGTWAIDDSIFGIRASGDRSKLSAQQLAYLKGHYTGDKLFIRDHYYSDKSPVPAMFLAGVYTLWERCTGWTAREQTGAFCYCMTLCSSGLAYVIAVWCVYRMGQQLGLRAWHSLFLAESLGLATVAPVYTQYVNNHMMFLGVAAAVVLFVAQIAALQRLNQRVPVRLLLLVGTLVGLGYSIDLGVGPALLLCVLGFVVWICRAVRPASVVLVSALPWLILHHALNYHIGGTLKPANAVPEYFLWPGSPFYPGNMTGGWSHSSIGHFFVYGTELLFGRRGFIGHNLPLFLLVPGILRLVWRRLPEWPELAFMGCWAGLTWLVYAAGSTNYSGLCCSIRWFVPLLAPGYYMLAVLLKHYPRYWSDFLILNTGGIFLAVLMWREGPWVMHTIPWFWPTQAVVLMTWLVWASGRRLREVCWANTPETPLEHAHAT